MARHKGLNKNKIPLLQQEGLGELGAPLKWNVKRGWGDLRKEGKT
jgi:hypothetical protein